MIFTIINNIPRITPEGLFIPEMRAIWEADKSDRKDEASQILIYIYHMADPKSVYNNLAEDKKEQTIINDYISNKSWQAGELEKAAIQKYKELVETPVYRMFKSVAIAMDKINIKLQEVELEDGKHGNMTQIAAIVEKAVKYAESYSKLKEIAEKELETVRKIKGGVSPSRILD